jgi:hypothetical protein
LDPSLDQNIPVFTKKCSPEAIYFNSATNCNKKHYLSPIGIKRPRLFLELRRLCEKKFLTAIISKRKSICFNETSNSVASFQL